MFRKAAILSIYISVPLLVLLTIITPPAPYGPEISTKVQAVVLIVQLICIYGIVLFFTSLVLYIKGKKQENMFRKAAILSIYISVPLLVLTYLIARYTIYSYPNFSHILMIIYFPIQLLLVVVMVAFSKNPHSPSIMAQIAIIIVQLIYIYVIVCCLVAFGLYIRRKQKKLSL